MHNDLSTPETVPDPGRRSFLKTGLGGALFRQIFRLIVQRHAEADDWFLNATFPFRGCYGDRVSHNETKQYSGYEISAADLLIAKYTNSSRMLPV